MKSFIRKLDRLLTTMAYAEAGDLDTVKEMLREDSSKVESAASDDEAHLLDPAQQTTQQHSSCV